ncbi:c-type cytochrome [Paucibacter sp. hw1]|uniref:C-type cytochrome n=2 Tax=Roseateles koreensis TaxID=2987526 RepID=A0ABT5KW28_9BURK|nr:c-type cytochrome [Roseateles koreensis]MDC8787144.1 c-type cytochrome [Roseateles koreensis]
MLGGAASVQAQAAGAASVQAKVAMCIGCHGIPGYRATFPELHKVPMIGGQNAKYIASALTAYSKGDRKHPTMRGIAQTLSEQDIADISAYYEAQAAAAGAAPVAETLAPAPAQVAELLTKGACASCHGANFSKPIDGSYPKLAGQYADYLYVALKSYQTEGNPVVGRGNAIMAGQVKQFSHAELKALAGYLASVPSELRTVPQSKFR